MDRYTILRNNKEYGPYSLQELNATGLLANDLIWVEGESSSWRSATEIGILQSLIKIPVTVNGSNNKTAAIVKPITTETLLEKKFHKSAGNIFVSQPPKKNGPSNKLSLPHAEEKAALAEKSIQLKDRKKQFSFNQSFLGLGILLVGALLGAFIMKQMVDSFGKEQMAIGEAKEIDSINVPASTTTPAAETSLALPDVAMVSTLTQDEKDSITKQTKPLSKPPIAAAHKLDTNEKNLIFKEPANDQLAVKDNMTTSDIQQVKNEEQKSGTGEVKKQSSNKASIEVIANDYKVGLFGGVSGLQISVTNTTSQNIENAIVEVEFLKPNGTVVKTELVSVQQVAAGASKTVPVPSSSRGVKVRCRIVSSNAKQEIIPTDNM